MCPRRPSWPPADRPESNTAHTAAFPPPAGAGPAPDAVFVAGPGMLPTSRLSQLLTRRSAGGSTVARKHKRWETQMSVTTFLQRATDSVIFAGCGKRWVFPQCREGADRD